MKKEELFEQISAVGLRKPIDKETLSTAFLTSPEMENCRGQLIRIEILGNVAFSGTEKTYRALLQIADPKYINNGGVKGTPQTYFRWSAGKKFIAHKYGLSILDKQGPKDRISGLIIGSLIRESEVFEDNTSHRKKLVKMAADFKKRFPDNALEFDEKDCNVQLTCRFIKNLGEKKTDESKEE